MYWPGRCVLRSDILLDKRNVFLLEAQNNWVEMSKPYLQYLYFMPVKRTIPHNSGMFFITFTCYQWLSLIDKVNGYEIIYKWFDHLKSNDHFINGHVIMPNHVHALISFINTTQSINTVIGNGKRFMAYEIINQLEKKL